MANASIFRYESRFDVHGDVFLPDSVEHPPALEEVPKNLRSFVGDLWSEFACHPEHESVSDTSCPYCEGSLAYVQTDRFIETRYGYGLTPLGNRGPLMPYTTGPGGFTACSTCGFWYIEEAAMGLALEEHFHLTVATLQQLDVNEPKVGLEELADHLARRVSDVYSLSPRRFEELVGYIFRNLGYCVRQTQQTRDGGHDLVLLGRSGKDRCSELAIVECKKYASDRRVSVGVVRQVLGVQLETGVRKAKIVASTLFTQPAIQTAQRVRSGNSGYELELVDIQRLTEILGVYANDGLDLASDPRFPATSRDAGL